MHARPPNGLPITCAERSEETVVDATATTTASGSSACWAAPCVTSRNSWSTYLDFVHLLSQVGTQDVPSVELSHFSITDVEPGPNVSEHRCRNVFPLAVPEPTKVHVFLFAVHVPDSVTPELA